MKFFKTLITAAISASLTVTAAFAVNDASGQLKGNNAEKKGKSEISERWNLKGKDSRPGCDSSMDPVKALEMKKEKVQILLKEGRITKEKANEITARIDARIKAIKEFNALPLQEKKDKLIKNFKAFMGMLVQEGKMTQDEANQRIQKFTEKIREWDGKGYPGLIKHRCIKKESVAHQ